MIQSKVKVKVKVKVTEVWNVRKYLILKSISSANTHVIKRLMVNYDTPRQWLNNFNWTDFLYSFSWAVTWPPNLGCSTFVKQILPLTKESIGSTVRGLFYLLHFLLYSCSLTFCSMKETFDLTRVWEAVHWLTECSMLALVCWLHFSRRTADGRDRAMSARHWWH